MALSQRARRVLVVVLALLALILVPVAFVMSAFVGNAPLEDGRSFGRVRTLKLGFVSAYLIDGGASLALIDTGADESGTALTAAIRAAGKAPEQVRAIFFTHGHQDHTSGARAFPWATTYALARELPMVEGATVGHSPLAKLRSPKPTGIKVGKVLEDGDSVPVGDLVVRAYALPGHTEGSAAYLVDGVLMLGDAANDKHGAVAGPPWIFSDDGALGLRSLHALAERLGGERQEVRALTFAHSGAIEGPNAIALLGAAR